MDPAIALLLRGALTLLFAAAAIAKLRDRRIFHGNVLAWRLLPARLAGRVADTLPWLEAALAAGIFAGLPLAAIGAAALFAAYGLGIAINLGRGRRVIDCGCGGPPQPLSGWHLVRNIGLVVVALATALLPPTTRAPTWVDAITVVAGSAAAALLYYAAHAMHALAPVHRTVAS